METKNPDYQDVIGRVLDASPSDYIKVCSIYKCGVSCLADIKCSELRDMYGQAVWKESCHVPVVISASLFCAEVHNSSQKTPIHSPASTIDDGRYVL